MTLNLPWKGVIILLSYTNISKLKTLKYELHYAFAIDFGFFSLYCEVLYANIFSPTSFFKYTTATPILIFSKLLRTYVCTGHYSLLMSTGYWNPLRLLGKSELILPLIDAVRAFAEKLHQITRREELFLSYRFFPAKEGVNQQNPLPSLHIVGCSSPNKIANICLKSLNSPTEVKNNVLIPLLLATW